MLHTRPPMDSSKNQPVVAEARPVAHSTEPQGAGPQPCTPAAPPPSRLHLSPEAGKTINSHLQVPATASVLSHGETTIPWALTSMERVEGPGPDSLGPCVSQQGRAQVLGWAFSPSTQPASHITLNYQFGTQCMQSPTLSRVECVASGTTGIRSVHVALVGFPAIAMQSYLCCVVTEGQEGTITNQAPSCPPGSQQSQE